MAKAIDFIPELADPTPGLERRLDAAPVKHAEAELAAYAILEEASRKQVLDFLHAAIGAKTEIFSTLADFGSKPVSVTAARNLIVLAKVLGSIDPEIVVKASKNLTATVDNRTKKASSPSLWQLFKRANHPEVRRGLSFLVDMTAALGRSLD